MRLSELNVWQAQRKEKKNRKSHKKIFSLYLNVTQLNCHMMKRQLKNRKSELKTKWKVNCGVCICLISHSNSIKINWFIHCASSLLSAFSFLVTALHQKSQSIDFPLTKKGWKTPKTIMKKWIKKRHVISSIFFLFSFYVRWKGISKSFYFVRL